MTEADDRNRETRETEESTSSPVRLVVRFLAILSALNLAYYVDKKLVLGVVDVPYTRFVTWVAGHLCAWILPYDILVTPYMIVAGGRTSVFVASGCNGLEAIFLLIAGIAAYPASWRVRLRGVARYVPALYALNLVRIVALVDIAHRHRAFLDVAHYQIAQGVLIVFVLGFWVHYVRNVDTCAA